MESENLNDLSSLITEEIYFIPGEFETKAETKKTTDSIKEESVVAEPALEAPIKKSEEPEVAKEPIQIRGEFAQQVLVLHEEDELPQEALDLLSKILGAVNHSMADVALLSSAELEGRTMEEFKEIGAHKIIRFGRIKHAINATPAPEYQVHSDEETEFLFVDALTQIKDDNTLKRKLWTALQVLFNVTK